jgi:regulator of protease activity HflC (stomatin/prohibitin superfamily)
MWMQKIVVADNQRAVELLDGRFQRVLGPGRYWRFGLAGRPEVRVDTLDRAQVSLAGIETLMRTNREALEREVFEVDLGKRELGLVYERGKLTRVLAPGSRQFYWLGADPVRVERIPLEALAIESTQLAELRSPATVELQREIQAAALIVEVAAEQVGLLMVDGALRAVLASGVYGYWRYGRNVRVDVVDTRLSELEVAGQEILTRDKVSLRVNLVAVYRVTDAVLAKTRVADVRAYAYRELQFGLRQAIGTRPLDALLADKGSIDGSVAEYAKVKLGEVGITLTSVGVKDLILPGEMKAILNQVVEAEKQAQANLIKRREETAATRSLLNTAKILEESPVLMRLKELEALEKITEKVGQLTVIGGFESVMKGLLPQ